MSRLKIPFTLDLRSLALFRIGLGFCLGADLLSRAFDLIAHYTDAGAYPRQFALDSTTNDFIFSFYFLHGSGFFTGLLFLLAFVFAGAVLLGFKTRVFLILSLVLLISLQNRNPLLLHKADTLLSCLCLWACFLPLDRYWSFDQKRGAIAGNIFPAVFSAATLAYVFQIIFIYTFSGLNKISPEWLSEGSALQLVFGRKEIATSLGEFFTNFPTLLTFSSRFIVFFEIFWPLLLLFPFLNNLSRTLFLGGIFLLQLGIFITLNVGLFPIIACLALLPMIPPSFYKKPIQTTETKVILTSSRLQNNLALGLFFMVILSNVNYLLQRFQVTEQFFLPITYLKIEEGAHFYQRWGMFSKPPKVSTRFVMPAQRSDGSVIDLLQPDTPFKWGEPTSVVDTFKNYRWRLFLYRLQEKERVVEQRSLLEYWCREWNAQEKQIKSLTFYVIHTSIPLDPKETKVSKPARRLTILCP